MDLLSTAEVAELLRVAPSTLRWWRGEGLGPRFTKLGGGRRVVYKRADVERWFELQYKRGA